jgi:hypothetical protein
MSACDRGTGTVKTWVPLTVINDRKLLRGELWTLKAVTLLSSARKREPITTSQAKASLQILQMLKCSIAVCVRFRLCMSMEWMNECVDWLFITQLLKACLSTVCMS